MNPLRSRLLDRLPDAAQWPLPAPHVDLLPTQTAAWAQARATLVPPRHRARWFAVEDDEGVAALAPLVLDGRWLREPPAMFEPSDFAWRTPQALTALARALVAQGRPLVLDRLPEQSPTLAALRQAFAGRGLLRVAPAMPTPTIDLGSGAQRIESVLSARRRADFRRYERRAGRHGELQFLLLAPGDGPALNDALHEALLVESRSWKVLAGTALTDDVVQGGFFHRFTRAAAAQGMLRIALLRLGGRPVAMQIAAQWRQRFWLFKIAHDQDFDDCSPGQLLMHHTLQHALREGLLSYELMGLMDDWTRLWTRHTRRHVRVQALPFSAASAVVLARRAARAGVDRLRRLRA